jgi:hypothetical protein
MKNIREQAIVLDMEYARTQPEAISSRTPQFRNIHFSNITAETKQAVFINGLTEMPVEDITFNNIQFESETGVSLNNAKSIEFHNIRINTKTGPSIVAENTSDIIIDGVRNLKPIAGIPVVRFVDVQNAFLYNNNPIAGSDIFLELKGAKTKEIHSKGNYFKQVKQAVTKSVEVDQTITLE